MGRLILVYGGSGSGKSAWAEQALLAEAARSPGGRAIYLATMEGTSPEAAARIARHRAMRSAHGEAAGRQFLTLERTVDIGSTAILDGDFVLLEDLGNLLANEIWSPEGAGPADAVDKISAGLSSLRERAELLVIVSNQVFSDGASYDPDTLSYIRGLGTLHRRLAAQAEQVVEAVCGIPVFIKRDTDHLL